MSPKSRPATLLASLGALGLIALGAPSAQAAQSVTIDYKCKFPLLGTQPLQLNLDLDLPDEIEVGQPTEAYAITASTTIAGTTSQGLGLVEGLQTLGGVTEAQKPGKGTGYRARVELADGSSVNVRVPINVEPYTIVPPIPNPLVLNGAGATPSLTLDVPGTARIVLTELILNLYGNDEGGTPVEGLNTPPTDIDRAPYADIDGDPGTFNVPCKLDPATQNVQIAAFELKSFRLKREIVGLEAPSAPASNAEQPGDRTCNAIRVRWTAATIVEGKINHYRVTYPGGPSDGVRTTRAETELLISGLQPDTEYVFSTTAYDDEDTDSLPFAQTLRTPASCDGPGEGQVATPQPASEYAYGVRGRIALKTLTRGSVPLSGGLDLEIAPGSSDATADLALSDGTGRLRALGFLPLTARFGFTTEGPTTGRFAGNTLRVETRLGIRLKQVKLFGLVRLPVGAGCETKSASDVVLQTTQAVFDPAKGGPIAGTYKLSNLTGCGLLNSVMSPLTAGSGNRISLQLTPAESAGS